jgi:type VI secretion system secreted protein VgrG
LARTQADRPFRLKSTLGDDALLLESFEGDERVSTPFRFVLRVLAEDPNVDMKGLLMKPLVLTIVLADKSERHIHGNISRMKLLEYGEDGLAAYEIEMVPWLWFLTLFTDCRIFQNKSVPDIVQQVFSDRGFSDYRLDLQGSYPPREYCVQYRETDLNFVSRLLEEEGIGYYFEQTLDKHTLVLFDNNVSLSACAKQAEARFTPAMGVLLDEDTVFRIEEELHIQTGQATLTDYDFEKPATNLLSSMTGAAPGEFYDYPGGYRTKNRGDVYSRIRLEEREVGIQTVQGETNCRGFECGYKFTLKEHFRDAANQEYLITALRHRGQNTSYRSNQNISAFEYSNHFEAIPSAVPFRPRRLARKPVIDGAQTAVVVGKSGEEIWTDKYGRVKVQFHWDHEGSADENSSCWIRVSQAWAGKMWGAIYTPRIGQEVIVTFLEGDPDQPIITGRVYNADQMPPYTLPDEQTKSTLKSMSSKGGGGFNEIRFEDKKGSEQVFIHGEKDLDIRVKNDRKEWIGNNRHLLVTNDKYEKIGNDSHSHVVGKQIEKVEKDHLVEILGKEGINVTGDQSLSVQGNVTDTFKGNYTLDVTQNIYIKGMQIVIEASTGLTLKVGGNFITIDPSGVAVKGTMVQLNSAGAALSGSAGQPVPVDPPTDPANADTANPGGTTSAPAAHTSPVANTSIQNIAPRQSTTEEEVPDRVVAPGQGGGRSSQPEYATFPRDVDPEAVAQVLRDAAESGAPFCEECQRAQQRQSGGSQ